MKFCFLLFSSYSIHTS